MANVNWIKLSVTTFEDEKMKLIKSLPEGRAIQLIWLRLLTFAGKTNDNGYVYIKGIPFTPEMIAIVFDEEPAVMKLALKTLQDFRMIEIDEKGLLILNWEKHQNVDGMERMKKQSTERVRKYRERQKQELLESEECNVTRNASVTPCNALDIEKEIEKEKETKPDIRVCGVDNKTPCKEEFELFWSHYPRQEGKGRALKCWNELLGDSNSSVKPEELIQAAKNYASYCEQKETELRYIKLPKTFLGDNLDYKDFVEPVKVVRKERPKEKSFDMQRALSCWIDAGLDPEDHAALKQWVVRGANVHELGYKQAASY